MNETICSTAPMILRPPEAPSAKRRPSPSSPMTGQKLPRQRLPGPSEFGLPGSGSNHMMPLLSSRPVDGDTTREPKIDSSVCVTEHMLPWRSTMLKCVVQDGACAASAMPAASPMPASRVLKASSSARA